MGEIRKAVLLLEQGDWEAAHVIVQDESSTLGSWAHGIVHMMEGDLSNAGYWYRRAGRRLPDVSRIGAEIIALKAEVSE